ncbi:MAG: CpsB/CapC family capsule biosynthesis tyrosine phosphatase [Eubacteriales bacterium]
MIDFSANYLPGFIGGSADGKSCSQRIKKLRAAGVDVMILTPRYYPSKLSVEEFIDRRDGAVEALGNGGGRFPMLIKACEVYIDKSLDSISTLGMLAIGGTRTIIADMPSGAWESELLNTIYGIQSADYDVIVAHIDRFTTAYAEDLFELGCKGTVDVSAFFGLSGFFRRQKLFRWIDEGKIVGIGTNFDRDNRHACDLMSRLPQILGKERTKKLEQTGKRLLGI